MFYGSAVLEKKKEPASLGSSFECLLSDMLLNGRKYRDLQPDRAAYVWCMNGAKSLEKHAIDVGFI